MRTRVTCVDSSSLFPFSNASASLPLGDNSSCLQDSFLHFPFLPPDYSSILPCVDIHNHGFFDEIESLDSSNINCAIQTSVCNGYNQDCGIDNDTIVEDSCTITNLVPVGSNETISYDLPSPLSLKTFTERRMRNKGRVPRKNCPRLIDPISRKRFSEASSGCRRSRKTSASSTRRKRKMVLECPNSTGLRLLFKKELRNSDVSSLGRVIIPKREAESNLPTLTCKEGIRIRIKDMASAHVWTMRYRYWPNNKSRMYVLQNARDFICMYRLTTGDTMSLYRDDEAGQYFISARKAENLVSSVMISGDVDSTNDGEVGPLLMDLSGSSNGEYGCGDDITAVTCEDSQEMVKEDDGCKTTSENSCTTTADLHGYKLSSLESFDSINDCDLSFCDIEEITVVN